MPDAHAKAEEIVSAGIEGGTGRDSVVDAVAEDLRTARADATATDDKIASLHAQALALSDAVEVIAYTAASVAPEIQAIKDGVHDLAAEHLRSSPDASHLGNWGRLPAVSDASEGKAPNAAPSGEFLPRTVDVHCPSGKHQQSVLTFRSHELAAMFCVPCQKGWTETVTHPALRDLATDSPR
jgi:hypothetical protein